MPRKKSAPKKNPRPAEDSPDENIAGEKSQANAEAFGVDAGMAGYDRLAERTMELWREQLSHFLNNPDAFNEFTKAIEPAGQLFTQGMDLWLMMVDQFGKTAQANPYTAAQERHERTDTANRAAPQGAGKAPNRSETASALSGASAYAVAELARRLAELEKRFAELEGNAGGRKNASAAAAGRKKTAQSYLREVSEAGQKRRRRV